MVTAFACFPWQKSILNAFNGISLAFYKMLIVKMLQLNEI